MDDPGETGEVDYDASGNDDRMDEDSVQLHAPAIEAPALSPANSSSLVVSPHSLEREINNQSKQIKILQDRISSLEQENETFRNNARDYDAHITRKWSIYWRPHTP